MAQCVFVFHQQLEPHCLSFVFKFAAHEAHQNDKLNNLFFLQIFRGMDRWLSIQDIKEWNRNGYKKGLRYVGRSNTSHLNSNKKLQCWHSHQVHRMMYIFTKLNDGTEENRNNHDIGSKIMKVHFAGLQAMIMEMEILLMVVEEFLHMHFFQHLVVMHILMTLSHGL